MSCISITFNVHTLIAGACWTLGLVLAGVDAFVDHELAALAVAFMVIGATVFVKGSVDRYAANWTQAYEVGKESGREQVRQLR